MVRHGMSSVPSPRGKWNSQPSATGSAVVWKVGSSSEVGPLGSRRSGEPKSIDESTSHSWPSMVTMLVPWEATPPSNIEEATGRTVNPQWCRSDHNAYDDGQHVPPTPWSSHARK